MAERAKTERRAVVNAGEKSSVSTEISKTTLVVVSILGATVGLWSFACLVGGLVASGGPLQLAGNWLKAVTGM